MLPTTEDEIEAAVRSVVAAHAQEDELLVLAMLGYEEYVTRTEPKGAAAPVLEEAAILRMRRLRRRGVRVTVIAEEFKVSRATVYDRTKGYEPDADIDPWDDLS